MKSTKSNQSEFDDLSMNCPSRKPKKGKLLTLIRKINLKKCLFPIAGLLSLIWFLVRVIPKPSRATYPCQRAAMPLASGFIVWLIGIVTSSLVYHRLRQWKPTYSLVTFLSVIVALVVVASGQIFTTLPTYLYPTPVVTADSVFVPIDPPNQPMGKARGIFPGRVVWDFSPGAANWDCSEDSYWWEDRFTNQTAVSTMLSQSIQRLTETSNDSAAWDVLFRYYNDTHDKGDIGYQTGEKIAIKLNFNFCHDSRESTNGTFASPQVVLALLRQLVYHAGVSDSLITFYDATRLVNLAVVDRCFMEFPGVRFVDWSGGDGIDKYQRDYSWRVRWSQRLTIRELGGTNPAYLPTCVTEADYIISLANLKGHAFSGVTLCAKNHFGSICANMTTWGGAQSPSQWAPKGAGLHPYIAVRYYSNGTPEWTFQPRPMGSYNPLVDLMGHKHLGEKTVLFIVDGLYGVQNGDSEVDSTQKWQSEPFNNNWTSSLFVSQDGVAIESVCLDFLRSEPTMWAVTGNVDNYLHEAALADSSPSGTVYDPEADGIPLTSLGVHEHWNNAADKQYSRNLGIGDGIELVSISSYTKVEPAKDHGKALTYQFNLQNYPNPFNPETVIQYELSEKGIVKLDIYDLLGRRICRLVEKMQDNGIHYVVWDGRDEQGTSAASGVYIYQLRFEKDGKEISQTAKRMVLVR